MIDIEAAECTEELCKPFEGWSAKPYLCPAGVWTIGYGATFYLDGRPVKPTDPPISRETGIRLLQAMITGVYQPGTQRLTPHLTGLILGAVTDFSYNLGLTRLAGSTLRRKLNFGDWQGAIVELRKWTRGGGRVLPGLVLRREAEIRKLPQR
jgi:lysozyme